MEDLQHRVATRFVYTTAPDLCRLHGARRARPCTALVRREGWHPDATIRPPRRPCWDKASYSNSCLCAVIGTSNEEALPLEHLWGPGPDFVFPNEPREESPALLLGLLIAKFGPKHGLCVHGIRPVPPFVRGIFLFAFGSLERHREIKISDTKGNVISETWRKVQSAIHR